MFLLSVPLSNYVRRAGELVSNATPQDIFKVLANQAMSQKVVITDELEHYLNTPTQTVPDMLRWWKDQREMYPHLSRMAIHYLTIPGTFSNGPPSLKLTCTYCFLDHSEFN